MPALIAVWQALLGELLLVTAICIAISSLDDIFIDIVYFSRILWRRATIYSRNPRASAESLRQPDPAAIAIIVPAWDEATVIGAMLRNLTTRLDYPRYRVFVGLYPNDPAGKAAVSRVGDHHIQAVMCSAPGPTTKADCLNHLWEAVVLHEAYGIR